MNGMNFSLLWSRRFGLALSPMFEPPDVSMPGEHYVLLDGGHGSFGLSVITENADPQEVAGWVWSSDLPHHVAINPPCVQVVRWDAAHSPHNYELKKVANDLDAFYRFLCGDRPRSNHTVVQHLVSVFGRIRSLGAYAGISDDRTVDAFVTMLADLISIDDARADPESFGLPVDASDLRNHLEGSGVRELMREIRTAPDTLSALSLNPSLAIRHAGGQIFQEAHFDLVRASPPDMFGYVDTARAERNTRGGIHFTPPALARSIADHTLGQIENLSTRRSLTVCDPACGSGAFLHEAIRGLRRAKFSGELNIIGNDVSAAAITMAKFTLKLALRDWTPDGGASLYLNVRDSLRAGQFPTADVIIMNPPFISAIAQSAQQKRQLKEVVGQRAASRGDYSMAFIAKGLESLTYGGAMGTLFPAGLLTHKAAAPWRSELAANGDIRLLASIGDFGMFSYALVHVACVVIGKSDPRGREFTALVTENDASATGDALRELRKVGGTSRGLDHSGNRWKLFSAKSSELRHQTWRMNTPKERTMLKAIGVAQNVAVRDLFKVRQGVQTGCRKAFLLREPEYNSLPSKERRYFRKALMTDSIRKGRIVGTYHLFFPHKKEGSIFEDEEALSCSVPTYYREYLKPNETKLRNRASISSAGRTDWWGLMRPRMFSFEFGPRIVSKFFGTSGSFICDLEGAYLPCTAHVWIPKAEGTFLDEHIDLQDEILGDVLLAYTALLNSRIFARLVSLRSNVVAGGQFDLSGRFVRDVYIPNLWEKLFDPLFGESVRKLSRITSDNINGIHSDSKSVEIAVAQLYGVPQLAKH